MSAPLESEPPLTSSAEMAAAGPAGLGPGERDVVAARYRLLEFIAEGGMGAVYRAEHVLSRKKLAIKVVHPYLCKGRQGVERFRREVSAAAEIDHPGIVQVYDAGVDDDGGFFMAMELLEGESLGDLLRREWPGMARAVRMVEGMLEPLAKAHAKGYVHRDLKPDNVFLAVDEEGRERVKILDFGLAREVTKSGATRTGITFGTPEYMSPEQAMSARKVRPPGDVWSVGVMLYELLSGEHPFSGETPNAIMANAIKEPLPPLADKAPHVPRPLAALIERCLEKKPENRPQNAGELLLALREVLGRVQLDDTAPATPVAPQKWQDEDEDEGGPDSSVFPLGPARSAAPSVDVLLAPEAPASAPPTPSSSLRLPLVIGGSVIGLALVAGAVIFAVQAVRTPPPMAVRELDAPALPEAVEEPAPVVEPTAPTPPAAEEPAPSVALAPAPEPPAPSPAPTQAPSQAPSQAPPEPTQASAPQADLAATEGPDRRTPNRRRPRGAEEEADTSALDEARACLALNNRPCARAILEQRARSAAEHALLIDIYWEQGMTEQALNRMERYVRQWGRTPAAERYRGILARHRGGR